MLVAGVVGLLNIGMGVVAAATPGGTPGVPTPIYFFVGGVLLLAAFGDLRIIRRGPLAGSRRLARHLWRMCFGLFIASGSFFFGQAQFLPKPVRSPALLAIPALAPLALLVYWMWRVRARQSLRGIVTARAVANVTMCVLAASLLLLAAANRVLLPPGRVIAGFGPGGVVYTGVRVNETGVRLERATVP